MLSIGVPQRSTSGPLLYVININGLPLSSVMCTDDSFLTIGAADVAGASRVCVELIREQKWYNRNSLTLNDCKT